MLTTSSADDGALIAVLVGINDYTTKMADGTKREGIVHQGITYGSLGCAVNDAALLHDLLRRTWSQRDPRLYLLTCPVPKFHVPGVDILEAFPGTRTSILEAIRTSVQGSLSSDTLLLYCAGHGTIDDDGRLCLVALPEPGKVGADLIPIDTIIGAAECCEASRRLIILDCCQTMPKRQGGQEAVIEYIHRLAHHWTVWLTCSPGECAYEGDDQLRFGVFMARLAEGICSIPGNPEDGSIDLLSLAASIPERVRDEIVYAPRGRLRRKDGRQAEESTLHEPRQRPVLIGPPIAASGPLRFPFAPRPVRTRRNLRQTCPLPGSKSTGVD